MMVVGMSRSTGARPNFAGTLVFAVVDWNETVWFASRTQTGVRTARGLELEISSLLLDLSIDRPTHIFFPHK